MAQLLASPVWAHVTTVGRREGKPPLPQLAHKLTQTVVNMDALAGEGAAAFAGADVAFCTLGTKRRIAGSAEAYIKAGRPGRAWAGLPGTVAVHTSWSPRSLLACAWRYRGCWQSCREPVQLCTCKTSLQQWDTRASAHWRGFHPTHMHLH